MKKPKCTDCKVTAKGLIITCDTCLLNKLAAAQRRQAKFRLFWENNPNAYNALEYRAAEQLVNRLSKRILKK